MDLSMCAAQDRKFNIETWIACIVFLAVLSVATSCGSYTVTWEVDLYISILNKTDANKLKFRVSHAQLAEGTSDIFEINLTPNDTDFETIYLTTLIVHTVKCNKGILTMNPGECSGKIPPAYRGPAYQGLDGFSIIDKFPNQICYFEPDKSRSYFLLTSDATCPQPSPPSDYTVHKSPFWVQNHETDSTNTLSISVKSGESISFEDPRIYPTYNITLQGPDGWVPGHFDLDNSGIFTIYPPTNTAPGNYPLHVTSNLRDGTDLNLTINTTVLQ